MVGGTPFWKVTSCAAGAPASSDDDGSTDDDDDSDAFATGAFLAGTLNLPERRPDTNFSI